MSVQSVEAMIKARNIRLLDLKSIDLEGRLHHITLPYRSGLVDTLMRDGVGFDGSSYGFQKVENSDMIMIPDLATAQVDPFRQTPTLSLFGNVFLTDQNRSPFSQDGRKIAAHAEQLLQSYTGADASMWGPEFEFYLFSHVEYDTRTSASYYRIEHEEEFYQRAYHAANPFDLYDDFRDEASLLLESLGIGVKYHHHEVGERGQQEIETRFYPLLQTADHIVLTKYALFNMAKERGLHITFMPKPMYNQAGNGMHLHLYLTRKGQNVFFQEDAYGHLNPLARQFMAGILRHGAALSAFTNPSTNSYKRLVPGFEAPVALTFGQGNRSSAIRIPKYIKDPNETRFEYRPPDATANPYLCLAAIMMAGIDGVVLGLDPEAEGFGPLDRKPTKEDNIRYLPRNLAESLDALREDCQFLLRDGCFSQALIDHWIGVKEKEIHAISTMPHPFEYKLYFTL